MPVKYTKTISTDFPNTKVSPSALETEITDSSIAIGLDHIDTHGDICDIWFNSSLSPAEETTLNNVVAAHQGTRTITEFIASGSLFSNEVNITEDQTWQVLGGIVTNPNFFVSNPNEATGRVVGEYQASGTGAELRLVEKSTGNVMNTSIYNLTDSSGSWEIAKFTSDVPPDSTYVERTYELQGRLNGATSAKIRFVSMSILKVRTE